MLCVEPLISLAATAFESVKRDLRLRVGLGAGASVLMSAGILGMGGVLSPNGVMYASERAIIPIERIEPRKIQIIDMPVSTVSQLIQSLPEAERFELVLYNSGASDILKRRGEYTIFVPSSPRFDYLPQRHIASLSRAQTYDFALGHILMRPLPLDESLNGTVITAGETFIHFKTNEANSQATIGNANILKAYKAKNGWIYIIDNVLTSPEAPGLSPLS